MYYFIAKNFLASMNTTGKITNIISVVGISLGSFALIISISVLNGFENLNPIFAFLGFRI